MEERKTSNVTVIDVTSLQEQTTEENDDNASLPSVVVDDDIRSRENNVDVVVNKSAPDEMTSHHKQQERNNSFKFSTTTYCGSCKKLLEEDFIGQCNDCSEQSNAIAIPQTKDCTKNVSLDKATSLQVNVEEYDNVREQPSPTKSINNERICRICLDNIDQGDLIAPCKCSGSTKYAHESCMLKWFFKSSKKSCEVCLGNVNVKPIGFKPFQEWRLPESGCDFIVYLFGLYFLIMVIFTGMITWIATQGCISPVCVTLYTVCAVAVFYFFYCCGCVEYSRRYWKALLSVNKVWRIYGRADSLKNFKHQVKRGRDLQTPVSLMQAKSDMQPYIINIENKLASPAACTTTEESSTVKCPSTSIGAETMNNNNNNNNDNNNINMGIDNVAMDIDDIN